MFENMKKSPPFPHPYAVCAPDNVSIKEYYKNHYDKQTIERIVKRCDLEGFYFDDKTEIYWSLR